MIPTTTHLPLHDEASGIANLKQQRVRDNDHWLSGLIDGFFYGAIFGALIVWALVLTFTK